MSEEQHDQRIDDVPTDEQQDKPDTNEPSDERKAELEAAYEQQKDTETPYKGVRIRALGELLWVFEQRQWSGEGRLSEGRQRPNLSGASLWYVNLSEAALWEVNLSGADLQGATLSGAHLRGANLSGATLRQANLSGADLMRANLSEADLREANLSGARLEGANLHGASLQETNLSRVNFRQANLRGASLVQANLSGAFLVRANLSGAYLREANLSGATLRQAKLSGADLYSADLTKAKLSDAILDNKTALGDITWDGVNLSQLNWELVKRLGDDDAEDVETGVKRLDMTARAYRQVTTQLRLQGMNEVADRFAYLAQLWQRRIMRQRLRWTNLRSFGPYLGSLLLWAVSGYGYRPGRTFATYLLVILAFAASFYVIGQSAGPHLSVLSAIVFSITSFHGRGFFPGGIALDDPLTVAAAGEAIIGLLVEVTFIATFTQRFFAR